MTKLRIRAMTFAIPAVGILLSAAIFAHAARGGEGGRGDGPEIYVLSQDLIFDSIVAAKPLPAHGPFQLLEPGGPTGLPSSLP